MLQSPNNHMLGNTIIEIYLALVCYYLKGQRKYIGCYFAHTMEKLLKQKKLNYYTSLFLSLQRNFIIGFNVSVNFNRSLKNLYYHKKWNEQRNIIYPLPHLSNLESLLPENPYHQKPLRKFLFSAFIITQSVAIM